MLPGSNDNKDNGYQTHHVELGTFISIPGMQCQCNVGNKLVICPQTRRICGS